MSLTSDSQRRSVTASWHRSPASRRGSQKKSTMKTTLILLGLALAAPLGAADASKILLSGSSVSVEDAKVSGTAKAIVGDMTVTADAIVFEKQKNVLRCEGAVTIRMADHVVTARDCTIELSAGEKKLFFLSAGSIQISPSTDPRFYPASATDLIGRRSDREKLIQDFTTRSERQKTPEKAPQPAP
jgi:hypothetical protein